MSGHTEGRLVAVADHQNAGQGLTLHFWRIDDERGNAICRISEKDGTIARRLAACWNACEGIPTEQLERDPQITMGQMLTVAASTRNELIEALRPFAKFACDEPCECNNCRARALLARLSPKERK